MDAVMGSSSPFLKLVSSRDKTMGFLCMRDDMLGKRSPLHHFRNNDKSKDVDFKLSLSFSSTRRGVRPISLSSSHTQAEVENYRLHSEESPNGYTNEAKAEAQTIRIRFQLQRECSFGQNFLIVGDDPVFGLWDPNNAIPLTWSDGHVWTVDLDIPIGKCIKFKFIMQERNGKFLWQPGPDRILEFWETEKTITLCEDWENPDSRRIIEADPTLNQFEEPAVTPEIKMVADNVGVPVEPSVTTAGTPKVKISNAKAQTKEAIEPKGYAINLKEVLASKEGVPVLVPGLSPLPTTDTDQEGSVNEAPKDDAEFVNGAAMVSTGADMAQDHKLPELDSKGDANASSYLNQRTAMSSIDENQDSCENKHQETQQIAEEQEHETTKPMRSLLLNDIQWGKNILQKLLNSFGIQ